jgi:hypothetical protein
LIKALRRQPFLSVELEERFVVQRDAFPPRQVCTRRYPNRRSCPARLETRSSRASWRACSSRSSEAARSCRRSSRASVYAVARRARRDRRRAADVREVGYGPSRASARDKRTFWCRSGPEAPCPAPVTRRHKGNVGLRPKADLGRAAASGPEPTDLRR